MIGYRDALASNKMLTQQITCFLCNFFSVGISALNFQKSLKRKIKFAETYCCNQGIKDLIERSLGGARAKKNNTVIH